MNEFLTILRNQIIPSATNPRKHFAQAMLTELAKSIKQSGVLQPVLLRPLPAARLPDTVGLKPRPSYELVAGERRWRAAGLIDLAYAMPAMIRDLSDAEVIDMQLAENMQREDLTHLEESDGIQLMVKAQEDGGLGLTIDQVAQRLGKSRRTIFARLTLQSLCESARQARYEGKIDDARAFEISRIPTQAGQGRALAEALRVDHQDQPKLSVRGLRTWIEQNVMLKISHAPFSIDSPDLPHADANKPCAGCPSNSAASRDLFDEPDAQDMCMNATCWRAKEAAHVDALEAQYEAKGFELIHGKEAKSLMPHGSYLAYNGKYQALKATVRGKDGKEFALKKALGKRFADCDPVAILSPHDHNEIIEAVNAEKAQKVLEELGLVEPEEKPAKPPKPDFSKEALEKVRIEQEMEAKAQEAIELDLLQAASELPLSMQTLAQQPVLLRWIADIIQDWIRPTEKRDDFIYGAHKSMKTMPDAEVSQALAKLLFVNAIEESEASERRALLKAFGIDLKASEQRVRKLLELEKAPSAPQETAPKPTKGKKAITPKASAQEASQGIAAALQAAEQTSAQQLTIGMQVQISQEANFTGTQTALQRYKGRKGTISKQINPACWEVTFKGAGGGKRDFLAHDLEIV